MSENFVALNVRVNRMQETPTPISMGDDDSPFTADMKSRISDDVERPKTKSQAPSLASFAIVDLAAEL